MLDLTTSSIALHVPHLRMLEAIGPNIDEIAEEFRVDPAAADSFRQRGRGKSFAQVGCAAVIPVLGVLTQRGDWISEALGWSNCDQISEIFDAAIGDPEARYVVLQMDSPGGSVAGVAELAAKIRAARSIKPIIACVDSLAASAAYWIASAASEIVITPSGQAGSIGVYVLHQDYSKANEMAGVKTTAIYAGKYKTEGNDFEPLGSTAQNAIQSEVDYYYAKFVRDVASNRRTSPAAVRGGYGQGRCLVAERALAAGLVDRVATTDSILAELNMPSDQRRRLAYSKMRQTQMNLEDDLLADRRRAHGDWSSE